MFFGNNDMDVQILSVIEMGWQRVAAKAGARPFHTLSFRVKGDALFFAQRQEPLKILESEITFVPADFDFAKHADEGRIIAIHFTTDAPLPDKILGFTPETPGKFRDMFQKLHKIWTQKAPGYGYEAKIIFYSIVLEMERQWSESRRNTAAEQIRPAISYINAHYMDGNLCVEELARMCAMSDTYLRKLFVAECGKTPQRYISDLRLATATELLRSGYYTVSEIAERCGFSNVNYFSTFIKKETGKSPLQYRKSLFTNQ